MTWKFSHLGIREAEENAIIYVRDTENPSNALGKTGFQIHF